MQVQCQPITYFGNRHRAGNAAPEYQFCIAVLDTLGKRMRGVVRDIQYRLNQLLFVAAKLGSRQVIVARD